MGDFVYINKLYFGCMYDILIEENKMDKSNNIKAKLNYNNNYIKCSYDNFFNLKDWKEKSYPEDDNYEYYKRVTRSNMVSIPICTLSEFNYNSPNINKFITLTIEMPKIDKTLKDDILDFEQYTDVFYDWDEAKLKADLILKDFGYNFKFKGGI
jgi:hypothetical protein